MSAEGKSRTRKSSGKMKAMPDKTAVRAAKRAKGDCSRRQRRGRPSRAENSAARENLLEAACRAFSTSPFDKVTMRRIARDAGYDQNLLYYYFGNKDDLFSRSVERIISSNQLTVDFGLDKQTHKEPVHISGTEFMDHFFRFLEHSPSGETYIRIVRNAAGNDHVLHLLVSTISQQLAKARPEPADIDHKDERMMLIASQLFGIVILRYIFRLEPLSSMPAHEVEQAVAPVIDHYLYGDIPFQG